MKSKGAALLRPYRQITMIFHNPAKYTPSELLQATAHRPYPLPEGRAWVMAQTWQHLLFAHWSVPTAMLRPMIPAGLEIDTWDGQAWVGVVPFRLTGLRLRGLPPLPLTNTFPELNVRTYVVKDGIPGVWFFSLDAANPLAVIGARVAFHLPYFNASMGIGVEGDVTHYISERTHRGANKAVFSGNYAPIDSVQNYPTDSLDRWLTERYALYAANKRGKIFRGDIHHHPWELQPAEAEIERNTMAEASGIMLPPTKPLLHYAHHIDMIGWRLVAV
jgi:uncharacterized protein YqjF (DUF2071 family)